MFSSSAMEKIWWFFYSVLSQFALHHQGIFRISGSQIEINIFREAFEKGNNIFSKLPNHYLDFKLKFSSSYLRLCKLGAHWCCCCR